MPKIELYTKELEYPVMVCTSKKCRTEFDILGEHKYEYNMKCHENCVLYGMKSNVIGDKSLKKCKIFNIFNDCKKCGCSYENHKHIYTENKVKVLETDDLEIEWREVTTTTKDMKLYVLDKLEQKKKELEYEKEMIIKSQAKFAYFVKKNAIAPFGDSFKNYIDMAIESKMTTDESSINEVRNRYTIDNLIKIREEYQELLKILETNSDSKEMSTESVFNLIDELYEMKHYGQLLKNMKELQEKARTLENLKISRDRIYERARPASAKLHENTINFGNLSPEKAIKIIKMLWQVLIEIVEITLDDLVDAHNTNETLGEMSNLDKIIIPEREIFIENLENPELTCTSCEIVCHSNCKVESEHGEIGNKLNKKCHVFKWLNFVKKDNCSVCNCSYKVHKVNRFVQKTIVKDKLVNLDLDIEKDIKKSFEEYLEIETNNLDKELDTILDYQVKFFNYLSKRTPFVKDIFLEYIASSISAEQSRSNTKKYDLLKKMTCDYFKKREQVVGEIQSNMIPAIISHLFSLENNGKRIEVIVQSKISFELTIIGPRARLSAPLYLN